MFGAFLDAAMSIPANMQMEEDRNQRQQNDWGMMQNQQEFNSAQAAIQRGWAENMSNTQYQRAAVDASSAGLNRILAMRQGGAGMPSASAASSGGGASSGGTPGSARSNLMQGEINSAAIANMREQNEQIRADTTLKNQDSALRSYEMNRVKAEERLTSQREETEKHNTSSARELARIHAADRRGRELEGAIDETKWGELFRYGDRAVRSLSPFRGGPPRGR